MNNDVYEICSEVERKKLYALLRESHMELLKFRFDREISDEQMPMKVEIEYYE